MAKAWGCDDSLHCMCLEGRAPDLHTSFRCGVQSWLNVDSLVDPTLRTSELNSIFKMQISNVEDRAQRLFTCCGCFFCMLLRWRSLMCFYLFAFENESGVEIHMYSKKYIVCMSGASGALTQLAISIIHMHVWKTCMNTRIAFCLLKHPKRRVW